MKLRYLAAAAVVAVASIVVATGALGQRSSDRGVLFAVLLGSKEVSPTTGKKNAGDRNGRGAATALIEGNQLCFGIVVRNLDTAPNAAHVHRGRPSVNGPIVIPLTRPDGGDPGSSSGCTDISSSLARQIRRNPSRFYVNVHTEDFPGGAVRGQLFARRR